MASNLPLSFLFLLALAYGALAAAPRKPLNVPFGRNYVPTWAFDHIKYKNGGAEVDLVLDKYTGTGFQSKGSYLFGHFSMSMKLVGGDSAGVVTAFYVTNSKSKSTLTPTLHSIFLIWKLLFLACSSLPKTPSTTKSTSSSWETDPGNPRFFKPTFSQGVKATENKGFTCGLIHPRNSTPTPSSGTYTW